VDSEEHKWKARLADKEGELSSSLAQAEDLREKVRALESSLKVVEQAEEVMMR